MKFAKIILIVGVIAIVSTCALLGLCLLRLAQVDKEKNVSQTANARANRWPKKEEKEEDPLIDPLDESFKGT